MNCPACNEKRIHTAEERAEYHPLAGHGWMDGHGWTCREAQEEHEEEELQRAAK
jgi:hypothetical protein